MRTQKIITLVLAVLAAVACIMLIPAHMHYRSVAAEYATQSAEINEMRSQVSAKEQSVSEVDTSEADALEAQQASLEKKVDTIKKDTVSDQETAETLTAEIAEKQSEYEEVNENEEYYDAVYEAYWEGYQKVLTYLAGN